MLSREQVHTILEGVAAQHAMKLDALAAFERREAQPAFDEGRYDSIINGLAHQLAANRGPSAKFGPADAELLATHNLPAVSADHVNSLLDELRHRRFLPTPRGKLEEIVARHDLEPTASNLAQADTAYLHGLARALLDVDSRWPKFSAAALEELHNSRDQQHGETGHPTGPVSSAEEAPRSGPSRTVSSVEPETIVSDQATEADAMPAQNIGAPLSAAKSPIINDLAKELERIKIKTKKWNDKSCKQAAQTFALFQRLVGVTDIRHVSQYTLAVFRDRLLSIPTTYDKSSANRDVPVEKLLALAEALPDDQVGLEPKTINRHLTFLNGLIRHSKSWGVRLDPTIDLSLLRMPVESKEMDERIRFSHEDLKTLFSAPTWSAPSNDSSADRVHDATYWVPLLGYYTGARREELCGLATADVRFSGDSAWLDLRPNTFRNLKNAHSARQIPLHPEILRLGFREYCDRIGELGYDLLFPDLTPASEDIPYGEQFYEQFKKILNQHLPRHQEESKSFHSFRHGFNIQLRKKKVFLELREELMGHKIGSQSADRYAEPFELDDKLEIIRLLEPITGALRPLPVRLKEAVGSRQPIRRARTRAEAGSSN